MIKVLAVWGGQSAEKLQMRSFATNSSAGAVNTCIKASPKRLALTSSLSLDPVKKVFSKISNGLSLQEPCSQWRNLCQNGLRKILLVLVYSYQVSWSAIFGGACRFSPSCSQYAVETLKLHSFSRALFLILRRLVRCRPGGPFGDDPVEQLCCSKKECHGTK